MKHTVRIIGTSHIYQVGGENCPNEDAKEFREYILSICKGGNIRGIAEEMSLQALEEKNVTDSVAQQVCDSLDLRHQFSDPSREERKILGICQDNDIVAEHLFDGWTKEQIDADVRERGSVPSDRIREKFWLRKIKELDVWPLLFICGENHFTPFAALLKAGCINVVETHPNWEPSANHGCCES